MKGEETSSSTSTGTSTFDPAQKDFYDKLLNQAGDWLAGGGIQSGTDFSDSMKDIMQNANSQYQEMIEGGYDKEALNNAMQANADAAYQNFNRNTMQSIGTTSQLTGGGSGSRRGIAEGLAASDLNSQINQQNQNMIWQAEQNALKNKQAGLQGQLGLLGQYANLSQYEQSMKNKYLESLLAYKDLISGDMGGTETTTGTTTGTAQTGGAWI